MTKGTNSPSCLFVYGTLAPGESNERFLKKLKGSWLAAKVRGKLYPKGIGPTKGYPVVELDPTGDLVNGQVFQSEQLDDIWNMLDEFEGKGYVRTLTPVELQNGETLTSYIYALDTELVKT